MPHFLETYVSDWHSLLHGAKVFLIQNLVVVMAVAAAVILFLFLAWVSGLRKRALARSETVHNELYAYHLDRIAGSLERIARFQRAGMEFRPAMQPKESDAEPEVPQHAGVGSMFGFGGRVNLANPLFRAK